MTKFSTKEIRRSFIDLILFVFIRSLYTFLVVKNLTGLYYPGSGSYGIDYNSAKEPLSFLLFIIVSAAFLLLRFNSDFKKNVAYTIFIIYFIPLNASYPIKNLPTDYLLLSTLFFILLILALKLFGNSRPLNCAKPDHNYEKKIENYVFWFCVLVCSFYIVYKFSYNGFSFFFSFESDEVYSYRTAYTDYLENVSGSLFAYATSIVRYLASFAVCALLYVSLKNRRIFGIVLSLFTVLCIYSVDSGKGTVFYVIIIFFIYFFWKKGWLQHYTRFFALSILGLLLLSTVEFVAFKRSIVFTYLIRREMYAPSWLNYLYYDFFSSNPKILWSQNVFIFQSFLPQHYSVGPLKLISDAYFQGVAPSPNTGLFAEAYMQFGVFGIFIYPLIISAILSFVEKQFYGVSSGLLIILALRIAISLTNIPILRTDFILTFVLFAAFLFLYKLFKPAGRAEVLVFERNRC